MRRRVVLFGVGALLSAFGGLVALLLRPTDSADAIRRYSAAACVAPHVVPTGRAWDNDITVRSSTVNVSADGFVGGLVLVRYPDGATRHVTMLRDYVYPHDIRLARESQTLWIVNSGLGAGIWPVAHLYQYDLPSRILVRDLDVDPDQLPEPCPATKTSLAQGDTR